MSLTRPNVVVYQEYSRVTIQADPPKLEVLVVGPCYQILDYADDKDDCNANTEYGTLEANSPAASPVAVMLDEPPNVKVGAEVVAEDVVVYLDNARVALAASEDNPPTAPTAYPTGAIFASGDNLFSAFTDDAGTDFAAQGVRSGDKLITNTGTGTFTVKTVKSILYTLVDTTGLLDFQDGNVTYAAVQVGDTITLEDDTAANERNGVYTVKNVQSNSVLELESTGWEANYATDVATTTVKITVTSISGVIRTGYPKASAVLANQSVLRVTSDFAVANSAVNAERQWRIERTIDNMELDASDVVVDGNTITVNAGITSSVTGFVSELPVTYGEIYVQYRALRKDLTTPMSYSDTSTMQADLGKYDSRNPLMVGAVIAKANTATSIKVYGLDEDSLLGYQRFLDAISSIRDIYAIVPLTYSTSILATISQTNQQLADPTYVLEQGIRQKFRVCIGAVEKLDSINVIEPKQGGTTSQITNAAPTGNYTLTTELSGSSAPTFDFVTDGVIPGDVVVLVKAAGPTTLRYTVTHVNETILGALSLETDTEVATYSPQAGDKFAVETADGDDRIAEVAFDTGVKEFTFVGGVLDKLYLVYNDATADFITNGVMVGDYLEIPTNANANVWTTYDTWEIAEVISESRVRVANLGRDTATNGYELPHGALRTGSALASANLYYRIARSTTKDQQIDMMISTALSFSSKRTVLCYPDSVMVTDLVDGSITPRQQSDTPEKAAAQPGYYMACVVGGQTAGQPSQQGFTALGAAGIDRVYGSNGYFKEEQLTELSNGGIYVFVQDTPTSLPYSIHEVTTDVSALEFGEYMVTKNFDYISWTFLDTIVPFIGRWNVIASTLEFIRQALLATGDTLKGQFVAKIGAPLTSYTIESVLPSEISADRVEAYVDVNMPMVLNTIGLHLVA